MRLHSHAPQSTAVQSAAVIPQPSLLVQRRCACGGIPGPDGECAACKAKRQALQNRTAESAPVQAPPIVHEVLRSPGQPLDSATRAFMEPRFGHDFSQVRVHTDARAAESAQAVGARAYAVGRNIVFSANQYSPKTWSGRQLLAHELAHTLQQGQVQPQPGVPLHTNEPGDAGEREAAQVAHNVLHNNGYAPSRQTPMRAAAQPTVQRELFAYKTEHTEILPTGEETGSTLYTTYTGDAIPIQNALAALIAANKIGTLNPPDRIHFFGRGATKAEVVNALTKAGYAKASQMADALLDDHNISVYSQEEVLKISGMFNFTIERETQSIEQQNPRPLTQAERAEVRLVFGNNLNLDQIMLAEDPVLTAGGIARTTPTAINLPPGTSRRSYFMYLLIHELTHTWQYQHGVSIATTASHAIFSTYDYGGEAGLRAATAAGRGFTSFNTEQQGDICEDYYRRLKAGQDVSAWQPFINEVKGIAKPVPASSP